MRRLMCKLQQATLLPRADCWRIVSWTTPLGLTASVGELLADARTGENPSGIAPGLLLAMASAHQKGGQEPTKNCFHRHSARA